MLFLTQAIFISAIVMLYIEVLSDSAMLKCVADNFLYFGEPLSLSVVGYLNGLLVRSPCAPNRLCFRSPW